MVFAFCPKDFVARSSTYGEKKREQRPGRTQVKLTKIRAKAGESEENPRTRIAKKRNNFKG